MKDSALRLNGKTVLLVGPFNGATQAILRTMTEFGADIGFVSDSAPYAATYCDGLNEAREVHAEYGRAAYLPLPIENEDQIQEALGRVVESIGRMDVLIDATPLSWTSKTDIPVAISNCRGLAEKIIPFFLAKQRGRIVYVMDDVSLAPILPSELAHSGREPLMKMIQELAIHYRQQNITVNALASGVTDDVLLKIFPKSTSLKKSFSTLIETHPTLKLVEFNDIGLSAAHLSSALSASLTGHLLRLTHGAHFEA